MDRKMVEEHLALAEEHVTIGDKNVANQRKAVADLERGGHDTAQARDLLQRFEEIQAMHIADLQRLRRELDNIFAR
jgi:hypothetical protein